MPPAASQETLRADDVARYNCRQKVSAAEARDAPGHVHEAEDRAVLGKGHAASRRAHAYERTSTFVPEILATCFGLSVLALAIFVGFGLIDSSVLTSVIAAIGRASAVLNANQKRKSSSWSIWIAVALLAGLAMLALAAWLVFDESAWQIVKTRFSFSPSA